MRTALVFAFSMGVVLWLGAGSALALSPTELLDKVDQAEHGPQDLSLVVKMILTEKGGNKSERKVSMHEKKGGKRIVKFLEPADVKDVAFLDEGADSLHLYLPAFQKVRRIAGSVRNDNFAGTDFSFEDLSAEPFSQRTDPIGFQEDGSHYLLELKTKPGRDSAYAKMVLRVRKNDFHYDQAEFFNTDGGLLKTFTRSDFRPVGRYSVPFASEMNDKRKSHATQMVVEKVEADTGLPDSFFSKRELKR